MGLNIAFQMDHIKTLSISGDTTFALCLEAQKRGHNIFHYTPEKLTYDNGKVTSLIEPLMVRDEEKNHFKLGKPYKTNFSEIDIILMRQEPPFDMNYITYTHILEHLMSKTRIINNPKRSVGDSSIKSIHEFSKINNFCLETASKKMIEENLIKPKAKVGLTLFLDLITK